MGYMMSRYLVADMSGSTTRQSTGGTGSNDNGDVQLPNFDHFQHVSPYQGYFISVTIEPNDQRQLSADEIQIAVDFLSNMEFVGMDL